MADRQPEQSGAAPVSPVAVRVAGALTAVEGVALAALALFLAIKPAFTPPRALAAAEALALFTLLSGGLLVGLGAALSHAKRWSRTPVLVLQLVALPVGATLAFQAGLVRFGAPILVLALATIGALARAESQGVFGR